MSNTIKKKVFLTEIKELVGDYSIENINIMLENNVKNPGLYYLILQCLVNLSDNYFPLVSKIISLLVTQKTIKSRHILLVLPYYLKYQSKDDVYKFYKNIVDIIPIDEKLILGLANIYPKLLDYYVNKYIKINEDYEDNPKEKINYNYGYLINQIEKFIKKKYSQKGLDRFLEHIPSKKYNIVFDGNNILLNTKGVIEKESYIQLMTLFLKCVDKGYNPLIFIHSRNVKQLKKMKLPLNFTFYPTPYRYNDDWFSLYYAIKNNCYLVSKDIFRDHINQYDTQNKTDHLKIFLDNKKLNIMDDFSDVIFEKRILSIIIKEDDNYYLPGIKGYKKI